MSSPASEQCSTFIVRSAHGTVPPLDQGPAHHRVAGAPIQIAPTTCTWRRSHHGPGSPSPSGFRWTEKTGVRVRYLFLWDRSHHILSMQHRSSSFHVPMNLAHTTKSLASRSRLQHAYPHTRTRVRAAGRRSQAPPPERLCLQTGSTSVPAPCACRCTHVSICCHTGARGSHRDSS